jgi:hypothetical protein
MDKRRFQRFSRPICMGNHLFIMPFLSSRTGSGQYKSGSDGHTLLGAYPCQLLTRQAVGTSASLSCSPALARVGASDYGQNAICDLSWPAMHLRIAIRFRLTLIPMGVAI